MIVVVSFPGSNCDRDVAHVCGEILGLPTELRWYAHETLPTNTSAVILPGGFSFGDYLRPGAIAARSAIMDAVSAFARGGGPVLGICNGFQMLLEANLLPGALTRNASLSFRCRPQTLEINARRPWLMNHFEHGELVQMPIAHARGRYVASDAELAMLRDHDQIVLRYDGESPNGSISQIAGICDVSGRVVGMMPHPERASDEALGGTDGLRLITAWLESST